MAKKILVVDDSAPLRQVVGIVLKSAGYEVVEASDGEEALGKLDGCKVHLIISDVNMPRMDGISFLKAAQARPDCRFTPVIMLTTEAGDVRKPESVALNAKAWMVKPFQPAHMLTTVSRLVMP